jgi:hypothetical protein
LNTKGSVFIQALLVVGLLSAVSGYVILNVESSAQSSRRARIKAEALRLGQSVAANLLDGDLCKKNFRIKSSSSPNFSSRTSLGNIPPELHNAIVGSSLPAEVSMVNPMTSPPTVSWVPSASASSSFGGLKLENISFLVTEKKSANDFKAKLKIRIKDTSSSPVPLSDFETDFALTTAPGAQNGIASCEADLTGKALCELKGGNWDTNRVPMCEFNIDELACPDDDDNPLTPPTARRFIKDILPNGDPVCADVAFSCPAGKYIRGFNARGEVECASFVALAAVTPTPSPTPTVVAPTPISTGPCLDRDYICPNVSRSAMLNTILPPGIPICTGYRYQQALGSIGWFEGGGCGSEFGQTQREGLIEGTITCSSQHSVLLSGELSTVNSCSSCTTTHRCVRAPEIMHTGVGCGTCPFGSTTTNIGFVAATVRFCNMQPGQVGRSRQSIVASYFGAYGPRNGAYQWNLYGPACNDGGHYSRSPLITGPPGVAQDLVWQISTP